MLETALRQDNCFVTLTYTDETLPLTSAGLPTLNQRDLQLWLKRLRKEIAPLRVRYFGVGEYSPSGRPHYHVIMFGLPTCKNGTTRVDYKGMLTPLECCPTCSLIQRNWANYTDLGSHLLGLIHVGSVTMESAAYVAGYVEKKMTAKDDYRLNGREPEFSAMSTRPGIGADFMWDVASTLMESDLHLKYDDVPSSLRHGKKVMPLGRYLRGKLREYVGKDKKAPQSTLDKMEEEMRPLRESAFNNSRSFKDEVVKYHDQAVLNWEARQAIFKSKKERLK